MSELITRVVGVRISEAIDDTRIWKGDNSEIFSCKSAFYALLNGIETPGLPQVRSL